MILSSCTSLALMILTFNHKNSIQGHNFIPQNEIDVKPNIVITIFVTAILLILIIAICAIGNFTVKKMRKLFKENYWGNSNSIMFSIGLISVANLFIIIWTVLRYVSNEAILKIEQQSLDKGDWNFALIYLGIELFCQYFPIGLEIFSVNVSIKGNWAELLYCELFLPDQTVE